MSISRLLAVFVSLAVMMTSALTYRPASLQATGPASSAAVLAWSSIARELVRRTGVTTGQGMASMALVHAAVYDAVVAIEGGYQPYQVALPRQPDASLDAAIAAAAYNVLVHYFPAQRAELDTSYAAALAAVPDGAAKDAGIAVGQATAAGLISARQGDGWGVDIGFTMRQPGPGVWQLPINVNPMTPWYAKLRPFMLERPEQFRPGPPLALGSEEWAEQFNEVKALGSANSTARTPEQTDVAWFWSANPVVQYNLAFEQAAVSRGLDAVETARLFAMGNLVGADALIACFDAKYHYLFWRPLFAIPQGEIDGNPATAGDPSWQPLLATPAHAEYPSGHGCLTGAEAEVFAAFFGTNRINIDIPSPGTRAQQKTRHYERVKDLTQEIVDARIWGGLHFRDAMVKGINVGRKVAHWTLKDHFLPVVDQGE